MTGQPPLAAVILAAAVMVAAVAWWLSGPGDESSPVTAPTVPPETAAIANDLDAPTTDVQEADALRPLEAEDDGFTDNLWAHISDAANSDLPPDLFADLSELAADVVRADATGEGRERWPHYWPSINQAARATPCCTRVEIHAAAAFRDDGAPDRVRAVVVWSSWRDGDPVLLEASTVVTLAEKGEMWTAVRD